MNFSSSSIFPYGALNPQLANGARQSDSFVYYDSDSIFPVIQKIIKKFDSTDVLRDSGPYRAVVLRIEQNEGEDPSIGTWIENVFPDPLEQRPNLVKIRARVPELQAHLPEPIIGDLSPQNQFLIGAHPLFIANNVNLPIPAEGSIIYVDFGNKVTFEDPIYLGPVLEGKGATANVASNSIANIFTQNELFNGGKVTMAGKVKHGKKEKVTMFVIHETAGFGRVNPEAGRPNAPSQAVCLWNGRDGSVAQTIPIETLDASSNWANSICLACETCNPTYFNKKERGYIVVGPDGDNSLKVNRTFTKQNFTLPSEIQCRRIWEMILLANRQFAGYVNIPMDRFPGNGSGSKFIWYRYAGNDKPGPSQGIGGIIDKTYTIPWWSQNKNLHSGIVCHHRWHHGDGLFIEFYCLGRSKGLSSSDAYIAGIGALLSIKDYLTSYNPREYLEKGKNAIGSLNKALDNILNPRIIKSDYPPNSSVQLKERMTIRKFSFNGQSISNISNPQDRFFEAGEF